MAKPKLGRRTIDSYTVKLIGVTIRAGDCVLMRLSESSKPSYVARVEQIEADGGGGNVRVKVRWYYRPEETIGGRRQFHGSKKMFRALDLFEAISDLWPEIESTFSHESVAVVRIEAEAALVKLGEAVRVILTQFEAAIQKDTSKTPSLRSICKFKLCNRIVRLQTNLFRVS